MQPASAARPDAAAAYRQRRTPRQMEAEVFVRANRSIREAMAEQSAAAIARAKGDNRRLWDVVLSLVVDPANQLPAPLRSQVASLAHAVLRECEADPPDFQFICEMNEAVAGGLWS
ncbi:flagellar biosynthesis regulator FlaF [Sediminicoccus sp. KRV36]|uniref:flagellar biosynthesis regulator FlaF n=1 Tax=Sediminicoccus sp. KRV36 TaxID=3133721 RepID=UPI00200C6F01|nr:flagellar biosynthesis regulator FlaF [Sediminicoccus rosea]UPY39222.1 flagellar biosynthesis regulator FlaF [Sediminicoccus rosea]